MIFCDMGRRFKSFQKRLLEGYESRMRIRKDHFENEMHHALKLQRESFMRSFKVYTHLEKKERIFLSSYSPVYLLLLLLQYKHTHNHHNHTKTDHNVSSFDWIEATKCLTCKKNQQHDAENNKAQRRRKYDWKPIWIPLEAIDCICKDREQRASFMFK